MDLRCAPDCSGILLTQPIGQAKDLAESRHWRPKDIESAIRNFDFFQNSSSFTIV